MSDDDRTDELGSLFESITGDTAVVESQRAETSARDVDDVEDGSVDAIDHHGFDDVIDDPEPVGDAA